MKIHGLVYMIPCNWAHNPKSFQQRRSTERLRENKSVQHLFLKPRIALSGEEAGDTPRMLI